MIHDLPGNFLMEGSFQGMQLKEALKLCQDLKRNHRIEPAMITKNKRETRGAASHE